MRVFAARDKRNSVHHHQPSAHKLHLPPPSGKSGTQRAGNDPFVPSGLSVHEIRCHRREQTYLAPLGHTAELSLRFGVASERKVIYMGKCIAISGFLVVWADQGGLQAGREFAGWRRRCEDLEEALSRRSEGLNFGVCLGLVVQPPPHHIIGLELGGCRRIRAIARRSLTSECSFGVSSTWSGDCFLCGQP